MNSGVKQKIENYLTTKYNTEQEKIREEARLKAAALPRLVVGNAGYSKFADDRHIRIQSECVRALVLRRTEIHLEAYELYDIAPDDAIVTDAKMLRDMTVAGRSSAVAGELRMEAMRTRRVGGHGAAISENFKRQLTVRTHSVMNEVSCMVEKARVMRSKKQNTLPNITVQGPNARVNINTVDNSQNEVKS